MVWGKAECPLRRGVNGEGDSGRIPRRASVNPILDHQDSGPAGIRGGSARGGAVDGMGVWGLEEEGMGLRIVGSLGDG